MVWTTVGVAAALMTSFAFLPQVYKMWRRRSAGDVSNLTMFQMLAGNSLWLTYGVGRRDAVLIGATVVAVSILAAGLVLYHRFSDMKAKGIIHGTLLGAEALGTDPLVAVRESSRGIVKAAAESGADPGEIARLALEEAALGSQAAVISVTPEEATVAVAAGAVDAAEEVGGRAGQAVEEAVAEAVAEYIPDTLFDPRD
jgi:MtN3 and saliva related transmembrane protein